MEKAKQIIATFLKVEQDSISENTVIDRTAIQGSIHLHRMYASLAETGIIIENRNSITTYGDLLRAIRSDKQSIDSPTNYKPKEQSKDSAIKAGVDIVDIKNLPTAEDFRTDLFYKDNFSPQEISYCILQANPVSAFAGRFALKEAIVKADNNYIKTPFNQIEIQKLKDGSLKFSGFSLSVSYAEDHAIAIAFKDSPIMNNKEIEDLIQKSIPRIEYHKPNKLLSIVALSMSLVTLGILLYLQL